MYAEFFGLKRPPFNSTLDSTFFFESPQHSEALASLIYAVQERKGIVVVTGDVGSGKSLVARVLVESIENADIAVVTDTHISGDDLLAAACREFQLPTDASFNTMDCLAALEEFLLTQHTKDRAAVLIIDDAHLLGDRHFEQLRLMANLEVSGGKLLQVVLLGQRELQLQMGGPASRPLRQRIFRSFHLSALSRDLTASYIRHRLSAAGATRQDVFDDEAVDLIHKYSAGLPRLINNLCDNVLLSAFSDDAGRIDHNRVNAVITEITSGDRDPATTLARGGPEDIDQAVEEITQRYVRSLETQISALDSSTADTDRRIAELNRLDVRLQSHEKKLTEQQEAAERRTRDLHKLTSALQEQEHSLKAREGAVAQRLETLESACGRLNSQENKLAEREARMVQQHRELERLSRTVSEQDQRLTERASFIEKKLSNRQVAFDRELNECKRAINRKWQDMKQLVIEHVSRDAEWSKRLAAVDLRMKRFESIEPDLSRVETKLLTTSATVQDNLNKQVHSAMTCAQEQEARLGALRSYMEADLAKLEARLIGARDTGFALEQQVGQRQQALQGTVESAGREREQLRSEMAVLLSNAEKLLGQPQEILDKANRQLAQVERMAGMVQKATMALQKTLDASTASAKELHGSADKTREQLEDVTEDAAHLLEQLAEQTTRTRKLRDVFQQIFSKADGHMTQLKRVQSESDGFMARVLRQAENLRESSAHPTRLVQELRSVGSAAERNIHEGVMKLGELKTMIDKAERARKSIEALIQATRRVAEARRTPLAAEATTVQRRVTSASSRAEVLSERGAATGRPTPLSQPGDEITT